MKKYIYKANSENPDETAHKEPSHLDFHYLQMYVRIYPMSEITWLYPILLLESIFSIEFVFILCYRQAWQALGDMSKETAMEEFAKMLDTICPLFKPYLQAQKAEQEKQAQLK